MTRRRNARRDGIDKLASMVTDSKAYPLNAEAFREVLSLVCCIPSQAAVWVSDRDLPTCINIARDTTTFTIKGNYITLYPPPAPDLAMPPEIVDFPDEFPEDIDSHGAIELLGLGGTAHLLYYLKLYGVTAVGTRPGTHGVRKIYRLADITPLIPKIAKKRRNMGKDRD
jgi:hypothetical protein